MFASVEEINDRYGNEMKNFFKPKKYNKEQKWHSILDEDNSKAFEIEMTQTLINVNCFITKIEIESWKMSEMTTLKKEEEKKFKEYLAMGRELLTKLKTLATLEKTSAMEKYEQSHVRKLSYAATEETASGIDNESVAEDHAIFSKEESFDRRDSRMITLIHKYAATFTKHYEVFNKMNHDVEEIVDRFNIILDFIHHQLQIRSSLSLALAKNESKLEKKSEWLPIVTCISEEKLNDQVSDELAISTDEDGKSMVDILSDHFGNSSVNITYKHVKVSGTGHLVDHTYSCEIANLYTEGKSRKKTKAKEEAATEMIKQIIRRQKSNNLPNQITPFNEQQMYELSVKLSEKEDFIEKLEEKCLHMHEPPPLYTIISETGKNNEAYYTVKCEALGYTALGHGIEKFQAKRNAAKSILNLVTMRKKSTVY